MKTAQNKSNKLCKISTKYLKFVILIISALIIVCLLINLIKPIPTLSDLIIGATAIIVLWYTYETHKIQIAEQMIANVNIQKSDREKMPVVQYHLKINPKDLFDVQFFVENLSEYRASVQVRINLMVNGYFYDNPLNEYNGNEYWNLNYRDNKMGHFSIINVLRTLELYSQEDLNKLDSFGDAYILDFIEKLPLAVEYFVEVYCSNEFKKSVYYPAISYKLDFQKRVCIPNMTSDKPYWEQSNQPDWV